MEFKKVKIGQNEYGQSKGQMKPVAGITNVNFDSPEFMSILSDIKHPDREAACDFALFMALCHTVLVEETERGTAYNASSPDELALVNAAKLFGFEFSGRDEEGNVIVKIFNERKVFKLLNVLEFNSERKRMSVIVKDSNNKIMLYCKGADNVIFERLLPRSANKEAVQRFLENSGNEGFRTLAFAAREIKEDEYNKWNARYQEAALSISEREKRIDEEAEKIERDLNLMGATAIEDKLQEEVSETIEFMKRAGIKLWMLTGDKVETAINIGYSCKLLTPLSVRTLIDARDSSAVLRQILEAQKQVQQFIFLINYSTMLMIELDLR